MESTILLIRSPRLLRMLLAKPGVSDAVEADCAGVARQLINRLCPIDCSRLSGNPDAQLQFRELLVWAETYDLVLIDSAPVSELMDAALLAPGVDGVVFCLRAGRASAPQALNTLPEMQGANGNVVGLALTFVPDERITVPALIQPCKLQVQRQLQAGHA